MTEDKKVEKVVRHDGYQPERGYSKKGYQPERGQLDSSKPPQSGSGVPTSTTNQKSNSEKKD
jgi:hypothetical protein